MAVSLGDILDKNRGIGPGFDFARIFLALCVLVWHVPETAYGPLVDTTHAPVTWIAHAAVLPMFFGLSGFLVAASAQRLSLANFVINRGLRIFPALIVEITLSALVLGPLLTAFGLHRYFTDPQFLHYFLNMLGIIHYRLPGLFLDNPEPFVVNGSLWTVPFEIICYLVLGALVMARLARERWLLVTLAIAFVVLATVTKAMLAPSLATAPTSAAGKFFQLYFASGGGPILVPCFLLGAAAYNFRERIAYDWRLFAGSLVILALIGMFAPSSTLDILPVIFILCPAMLYIVLFVGMTRFPPIPLYSRGDYSYGIYLYGYPLQQTLIHLFPALRFWPYHLVASIVCASAFAAFSWHVIEKPILKLRKNFSFASRAKPAMRGSGDR